MADNFNARLYTRGYASTVTMRAPTTSPPAPAMCAPACVCGLLECLCRPRFFAGQLLTEQDLNRLDAYIRAKNRLHTLQLHGWGVVNGLMVRCEPCGTGVVVGTGYAISPCGEDIIVCSDTSVDICSLIKQCQPPDVSCQPYSRGMAAKGCDDLVEQWVLAIRYTETPTRGVTALRMGSTCGCKQASCTAPAASGGCGCGATGTNTTPTNPIAAPASTVRPRGASPECEPTAICEGYSFDVFPAPITVPRDVKNVQIPGALIENFLCCLQPLIDSLPTPPAVPNAANFAAQPAAWNLWCCRTKEALIGYFSTGPEPNCTILGKLQAWACPDPQSQNFAQEMLAAYTVLLALLLDAMLACLCAALLPPAPYGTSDDRVPLAIVSVRKRDCKVLEVCNWTSLRKQVITWPAIEYWLSWIPWLASLGDIIGTLCCRDIKLPPPRQEGNATFVAESHPASDAAMLEVNPTLDVDRIADNQTLTALITDAFARARAPLDPSAIVGGVFGFDSGAKQPLSDAEKANVAPFLLLNQVLRPIASSLAPASMAGQAPSQVVENVTSGGDETVALHRRVTALEAAIKQMQTKA